jgi:hypothetical protein
MARTSVVESCNEVVRLRMYVIVNNCRVSQRNTKGDLASVNGGKLLLLNGIIT